ncbi:hypothetical protein BDV93DRAFT_371646 [Ceratobasidium sp. AG-I]|nr:hypothetical protein BDV93DRAFT_371646 [Ceratobasidium sp. AG-I]
MVEQQAGSPPYWPSPTNGCSQGRLIARYPVDRPGRSPSTSLPLARESSPMASEEFRIAYARRTAPRHRDVERTSEAETRARECAGTTDPRPAGLSSHNETRPRPLVAVRSPPIESRVPDNTGSEIKIRPRILRGREWHTDAIGQRARKRMHTWRSDANDQRTTWPFSQSHDNRRHGAHGPGWVLRSQDRRTSAKEIQAHGGRSTPPSRILSAPTELRRTRRPTRSSTGTSRSRRPYLTDADNDGTESTGGSEHFGSAVPRGPHTEFAVKSQLARV